MIACDRCGKDVWMFATRSSGVVGICGPKMWFCIIALCHHGRSAFATGMLSCMIGQSACGIVHGWIIGNGRMGSEA